jgi:hypothetical protein
MHVPVGGNKYRCYLELNLLDVYLQYIYISTSIPGEVDTIIHTHTGGERNKKEETKRERERQRRKKEKRKKE